MCRKIKVYSIIIMFCFCICGCTNSKFTIEEDVVSEINQTLEMSEAISVEPEIEAESEAEGYEQFGEIVDGVQEISGAETGFDEIISILDEIDECAFIVGNYESGWKILYNGAQYEMLQDEIMYIIGKDMKVGTDVKVQCTNDWCDVSPNWNFGDYPYGCDIETTGQNIPISVRVLYQDGSIDYITITVSKEWKYSWEEDVVAE